MSCQFLTVLSDLAVFRDLVCISRFVLFQIYEFFCIPLGYLTFLVSSVVLVLW